MTIDFIIVSGIIGALMPLFISLVKSEALSTQAKRVLAVLVSAVAAYVHVGVELGWTGFDWTQLLASFGIIYSQAQIFYKGFWEDSVVDRTLTLAFYGPNELEAAA